MMPKWVYLFYVESAWRGLNAPACKKLLEDHPQLANDVVIAALPGEAGDTPLEPFIKETSNVGATLIPHAGGSTIPFLNQGAYARITQGKTLDVNGAFSGKFWAQVFETTGNLTSAHSQPTFVLEDEGFELLPQSREPYANMSNALAHSLTLPYDKFKLFDKRDGANSVRTVANPRKKSTLDLLLSGKTPGLKISSSDAEKLSELIEKNDLIYSAEAFEKLVAKSVSISAGGVSDQIALMPANAKNNVIGLMGLPEHQKKTIFYILTSARGNKMFAHGETLNYGICFAGTSQDNSVAKSYIAGNIW